MATTTAVDANTLQAYHRDAHLQNLVATVTNCTVISNDKWSVQLSDTVLFPEGGGQPSDTGTIAGVPVSDVQHDDNGLVVHTVNSPLEVGAQVELCVDWKRRQHHMQHVSTV